ncbi:MAG: FHA domain-containing protein [Alphaproteobacteria bacterium]|nr:FHA domain-containing protein [Alphaproteobacteria bacterium]
MENKKITIGRSGKCDLVIEDIPQNAKVSGCHATIIETGDPNDMQFILEDHSTNGTFVNSQLVHNGTYHIKEGDAITLGRDYLLDWGQILPFFEGRKTQRKSIGKETVVKPHDGSTPNRDGYNSPPPVFPDPLPLINGEPAKDDTKEFVFTGLHWLITIGAAIIGFFLGLFADL